MLLRKCMLYMLQRYHNNKIALFNYRFSMDRLFDTFYRYKRLRHFVCMLLLVSEYDWARARRRIACTCCWVREIAASYSIINSLWIEIKSVMYTKTRLRIVDTPFHQSQHHFHHWYPQSRLDPSKGVMCGMRYQLFISISPNLSPLTSITHNSRGGFGPAT